MCVLPAGMCMNHVHSVPTEVRREYWITSKWSYRRLWVMMWALGIEPWSSTRATSVLNHWAISPSPVELNPLNLILIFIDYPFFGHGFPNLASYIYYVEYIEYFSQYWWLINVPYCLNTWKTIQLSVRSPNPNTPKNSCFHTSSRLALPRRSLNDFLMLGCLNEFAMISFLL